MKNEIYFAKFVFSKNIGEACFEKASKNGIFNKKSIYSEKNGYNEAESSIIRNLVGMSGEIMVGSFFQNLKYVDKKTNDYKFIDEKNNLEKKIEVKTKLVHSTDNPLIDYDGSIYKYSKNFQKPDGYFFCRVFLLNNKPQMGWIVGYCSGDLFDKKKTFRKKGNRDGKNWHLCPEDCYNIEYKHLKGIDKKFGPLQLDADENRNVILNGKILDFKYFIDMGIKS